MATFRTRKKQFRAYYDAGSLGSLPCTQQQAYLNNCVDEALASRIGRESTGTTPVYSPIQGLMTCIHVLDNYFLQVNPIHLLRKQFFDARQKEGQSIIEFRDELLSLIDCSIITLSGRKVELLRVITSCIAVCTFVLYVRMYQ